MEVWTWKPTRDRRSPLSSRTRPVAMAELRARSTMSQEHLDAQLRTDNANWIGCQFSSALSLHTRRPPSTVLSIVQLSQLVGISICNCIHCNCSSEVFTQPFNDMLTHDFHTFKSV